MSTPPQADNRQVVGLQPWLPWPLAASRWWTEPVRAEALAALRIGVALVLLVDVVFTFWPLRHDFFGPNSLGSVEVFEYLARNHKWNWSLLRGFTDPLLSALVLLAWVVCTMFVLVGLRARLHSTVVDPPTLRWALAIWAVSSLVGVLGIWARIPIPEANAEPEVIDTLAGLVLRAPLVVFGVALLFLWLGIWRRSQSGPQDEWVWRWIVGCTVVGGLLAMVGWLKHQNWTADPTGPEWLRWTKNQWLMEPRAIDVFMVVWIAAVLLLLLGLGTRVSAVAVWALGMSFDNLNSNVNNAGDQVRSILTFYLMLCPCGAVWSLDSWLAKRWRKSSGGPVYVWPWPLRLLFVQMIFIYFLNGLYKLSGKDWNSGVSLYYVLNDIVLSRVAYELVPIPLEIVRVMSWSVMVWEVSFPVLVMFRWTRVVALLFGVGFHLGIFLTMEIGPFAPYMLTMYLPLLPWDWWLQRRARRKAQAAQSPVVQATVPALQSVSNKVKEPGQEPLVAPSAVSEGSATS